MEKEIPFLQLYDHYSAYNDIKSDLLGDPPLRVIHPYSYFRIKRRNWTFMDMKGNRARKNDA